MNCYTILAMTCVAYQVAADTSGHAAVAGHQHTETSGYGVPEYYNEVGYSTGSGSGYASGYDEVVSYDKGPKFPDWLMPALLIVCGCALLIPSWTMIPTPVLPGDRKKRAAEADNNTFSMLRELAPLFYSKDCILRVGCEMLEVERSGNYRALSTAFSPLSTMYGSFYTEELCSNLACPIRSDDYFSNHL